MSRMLTREIPARRLRPGVAPDAVIVRVVGLSIAVGQSGNVVRSPVTTIYEVCIDGEVKGLERMTDLELLYGPETLFEDRFGAFYVCAKLFDRDIYGVDRASTKWRD